MTKVHECPVPTDSLLAAYGGPQDYRDCFYRDMTGEIALGAFIERFYSSAVFLPERLLLRLIAGPSSSADIKALANSETDRFGAWRVVERREEQIMLESKPTGTASWLSVEPKGDGTRLLFGSWVGSIGTSGWKGLLSAHVWYSRMLLGAV